MVEGLVREFVPPELAAGLNFRGLQRVNPKFYPNRGSARRREADVIWRLPTRKDRGRYLYLLIEFQSIRDEWMAVRTQVYQGLLWQQVIDEQRPQDRAHLHPLLSIVLYNGERRWEAATETGALIELSPDSSLWPWQPQVRYCLLDIGAFPRKELVRRSSPVALLFRLDHLNSPGEFTEVIERLRGWFRKHKGCGRLPRLFAELIREALDERGVRLPNSDNLLEMNMKSMLGTRMKAWEKQWLAEGKSEGKAEGKAEDLITLLAERFGSVAPSWRKRIRGAKLSTLERWFKRAISAPDLPSVFNPPH